MSGTTTKTSKTVTVEKRGGFHDDAFFKVCPYINLYDFTHVPDL